MSKLHKIENKNDPNVIYLLWCPGCKEPHPFGVPRWSFNGDMEKPTFQPSLLCNANVEEGRFRCHSFVTDGKIQFLPDCHHELAGQTVDIPDWDDYKDEGKTE